MRILITGRHLTPASSVIQALPKNTDVLYVGRKDAVEGYKELSLEYRTITSLGIPFAEITAGRIQRRLTKHTIPSVSKIPKGFCDAYRIIHSFSPEVILSFGSYVALPVGLAAYFMKIPLIIHEQTMHAGLANRLMAPFAKTICISWEESKNYFPKQKLELTGNPLPENKPSEQIIKLLNKDASKPLLCIVGGSQGSHAINMFILPILKDLLEKYRVIHQTGDAREFNDFEKLTISRDLLREELQERYMQFKFIDPSDIAFVFQKSDLVVTRAGINTIQMLLVENNPSLVIPLPSAEKRDQYENALFLKKAGLGEIFIQSEVTSDSLLTCVNDMIEDRHKYTCPDVQKFINLHKGAAERIVKILEYATTSGKNQKKS